MKTICITGIGGYLGLATAFKLREAGYTVIGIGSKSERPKNLPSDVIYTVIDIRDEVALATFFRQHEVATIYHFAAIKFVGKCETEPELCYDINTKGTKMVLAAMRAANVPHIIYASTYAIYDWTGDQLILTESTPTMPLTVYGKSKLKSEQAIKEAAEIGQIARYHILRYGNIVGAIAEIHQHTPQSFLDKIVLATKTGDTIALNGEDYNTSDGSVARDFIDIRDVVSVNMMVLSRTESGIYNVSSGVATTLRQLIILSEKVSSNTITVTVNQKNGKEPSLITVDNTKVKNELGFQPRTNLEQTIAGIYEKLVA